MDGESHIPDYARRQVDAKRIDPFRIPRMMMYVWLFWPLAGSVIAVAVLWIVSKAK